MWPLGGRIGLEEAVTKTDRVRVPKEHRWEMLLRVRQWCRDRGIHLTIIVPWYEEFEDHVDLLRNFAQQHDVPIVLMNPTRSPMLQCGLDS